MVLQDLGEGGLVVDAGQPSRETLMPNEGVAPYELSTTCSPIGYSVGVGECENPSLSYQGEGIDLDKPGWDDEMNDAPSV